jgi:hypothetical protein
MSESKSAITDVGGPATAAERRRTTRVPTDSLSVAVESGSLRLSGRVRDVSRGGLRIVFPEAGEAVPAIGAGAPVRVMHATLGAPLEGLCVRRGPGEIGVQFRADTGEVERTLQCLALILEDGRTD